MKKSTMFYLVFFLAMIVVPPAMAEEPQLARVVTGYVDIGDNQYIDYASMAMNGSHLCSSNGLEKGFATQEQFAAYIEAYPDTDLVWEGQVENWYQVRCTTPPMTVKDFYQAKFHVDLVDLQGRLAAHDDWGQVYLPLPLPPASMTFFAD